jgi:hypothetical protein
MMRRVLALFVVMSWITLSGVDALEDLDFDSHTTRDAGAAAGWPTASKPAKLANNILELANSNPHRLGNLIKYLVLQDLGRKTLTDEYSRLKTLRSQKEHRVLII